MSGPNVDLCEIMNLANDQSIGMQMGKNRFGGCVSTGKFGPGPSSL